jgi:hypothetical protein
MKLALAAVLAIGAIAAAGSAQAAPVASSETLDWTLSGPAPSLGGVPFPGSGTITVTIEASGGDLVTGLTGQINGSNITSFTSGGLLFLNTNGTSLLNSTGLSFMTAAGMDVNIFGFFQPGTPATGNAYGELTSNPSAFGVGTFAVTATPVPAALPLFAGGLGALGLFGWRKKRTSRSMAA